MIDIPTSQFHVMITRTMRLWAPTTIEAIGEHSKRMGNGQILIVVGAGLHVGIHSVGTEHFASYFPKTP